MSSPGSRRNYVSINVRVLSVRLFIAHEALIHLNNVFWQLKWYLCSIDGLINYFKLRDKWAAITASSFINSVNVIHASVMSSPSLLLWKVIYVFQLQKRVGYNISSWILTTISAFYFWEKFKPAFFAITCRVYKRALIIAERSAFFTADNVIVRNINDETREFFWI